MVFKNLMPVTIMEETNIFASLQDFLDSDLLDLYPQALERISNDTANMIAMIEQGEQESALVLAHGLRSILVLFKFEDLSRDLSVVTHMLQEADHSAVDLLIKMNTQAKHLLFQFTSAMHGKGI